MTKIMGYDLTPKNDDAGDFHFGAFSFPVLLEACGYLFSSIHNGGRWYCTFGTDPRMGDSYPLILSNDGFAVTDEEAKIMARIARNFVAVQRTLPDEQKGDGMESDGVFDRARIEKLMIQAMHADSPQKWPIKIRTDFTNRFEKFAEWAEKSGGFEIW
jgi:hypothetical protein